METTKFNDSIAKQANEIPATKLPATGTLAKNGGTPERRLFHYTSASSLLGILNQKMIKVATAGVPPGETPAVWFSYAPLWERTANKTFVNSESGSPTFTHGLKGQAKYETPARLLMATDMPGLMSWKSFKNSPHISPRSARLLEKAARADFSNPNDWMIVLSPVSLDYVKAIEIYHDDEWHSFRDVIDGKRDLLIASEMPALTRIPAWFANGPQAL